VTTPAEITVRRAIDTDRPAVLHLLADSLGWDRDETFADFFRWKHHDNVFGTSPAWVALHDGAVVGYRTFLRWRFLDDEGKQVFPIITEYWLNVTNAK